MENTVWKKTTEERYNAELDHMIPTAMTNCGFLVGEPDDHNAERQPRYAAFVKINGQFFESTAPITINEFDSLKISDVMAAGPEGHEQPRSKLSARDLPLGGGGGADRGMKKNG